MKTYRQVIFMQGEEADEVLKILYEKGVSDAIEYLKQWDCGEGEELNESRKGTSDYFQQVGSYLISYNKGLNYIGLEEVI